MLLNLLIRVLRLLNDLVPIPPLVLALALLVRLRVLSLPLILPLIPSFFLLPLLTLVRPLSLVLIVAYPSRQMSIRFTMNPPLFPPLYLLFEIPLLPFNRCPHTLLQEHSLLRVRVLTCRVHLHLNASRQDLH